MSRDFAKTPASKRKKPAASRGKNDPGGSAAKRKPARASTRRSKKKAQGPGLGKTLLIVGCIFIVLGSFGAGLMWLLDNSDTPTPQVVEKPKKPAVAEKPVAKPEPKPEKKPAKQPVVKAEPKEPEFEFYTELPKMEVEVPQPEVKPTRASYEYTLQIASFKQRNEADAMIAKLALLGKEAWISERASNGTTWYRVRLGPWQSKRKLDKVRHQLQQNKINNAMVLRVRKEG